MTVREAVYLLQPPTTWTSTFCSLPQCSVFNYCTFVHHTHMSVVFERGVIGLRSVPDVVFRVFTELWPLTNELTHNVTVAGMRLRISVVQQIWNVLHSAEYTNDHVCVDPLSEWVPCPSLVTYLCIQAKVVGWTVLYWGLGALTSCHLP